MADSSTDEGERQMPAPRHHSYQTKIVERWQAAYRKVNGREPPHIEHAGRGWWKIDGTHKMFRLATIEHFAIVLERCPDATSESLQTETIDRLFLELSQFTKATTAKELALKGKLARLLVAVEPFAQLVKTTDGRIPTERLSASDWHKLTQAFENAAEGWER